MKVYVIKATLAFSNPQSIRYILISLEETLEKFYFVLKIAMSIDSGDYAFYNIDERISLKQKIKDAFLKYSDLVMYYNHPANGANPNPTSKSFTFYLDLVESRDIDDYTAPEVIRANGYNMMENTYNVYSFNERVRRLRAEYYSRKLDAYEYDESAVRKNILREFRPDLLPPSVDMSLGIPFIEILFACSLNELKKYAREYDIYTGYYADKYSIAMSIVRELIYNSDELFFVLEQMNTNQWNALIQYVTKGQLPTDGSNLYELLYNLVELKLMVKKGKNGFSFANELLEFIQGILDDEYDESGIDRIIEVLDNNYLHGLMDNE